MFHAKGSMTLFSKFSTDWCTTEVGVPSDDEKGLGYIKEDFSGNWECLFGIRSSTTKDALTVFFFSNSPGTWRLV